MGGATNWVTWLQAGLLNTAIYMYDILFQARVQLSLASKNALFWREQLLGAPFACGRGTPWIMSLSIDFLMLRYPRVWRGCTIQPQPYLTPATFLALPTPSPAFATDVGHAAPTRAH